MWIHRRDAESAEEDAEKGKTLFGFLCAYLCVLCASAVNRHSRRGTGLRSCAGPLGPGLGLGGDGLMGGDDFTVADQGVHWGSRVGVDVDSPQRRRERRGRRRERQNPLWFSLRLSLCPLRLCGE